MASSRSDTQANAGVIKHIPGRVFTAAAHQKKKVISPHDVKLVEGVLLQQCVGEESDKQTRLSRNCLWEHFILLILITTATVNM